jgi:penicillin-binding protein 2
VAAQAALENGIDYEILSSLIQSPYTAQVSYRVVLHSVLVGDISRNTAMNLTMEAGGWRVQWDDTLILPELTSGNYLLMDYQIPARANIYDRYGNALVSENDAVAVGLDTGALDMENLDGLLSVIARMTNNEIVIEDLRLKIESYRQNGWYLPVTDLSVDRISPFLGSLSSLPGVILGDFSTRYYQGIGPHVVGYMSLIHVEEVEVYQRLGYRQDERVGRDGLELWGEQYLAGKRAGTLYVMSPENKVVTILAQTNAEPSQAIYTTIDQDLQRGTQDALRGFRGAAVVMEVNTGRVLAMASSPGFNANLFEPANMNQQDQIGELSTEDLPMFNRATLGQYPLGSVFKIITMAAGLKSGVFTPDTTYECGYHFTELFGVTLNDWTWDHFQEDGETMPSGTLTLQQGLMRSCNPWFYHIGLDLFSRGLTTDVSNLARAFGLGSPTGIQIGEEDGSIVDPESQLDATNNAIGQGQTLVTPIQVANFIAAVGNGGTLYKPSVIERIQPPVGEPTYEFTSTVRGTLPISDTVLASIQEAMQWVVTNPRGTATYVFRGLNINMAGKTGTAQDPPRDPHAWFAAYTFENNPNRPDIAVVVVLENQGEGSEWAAPVARRIMEVYFSGKPLRLYSWESSFGVWKTETPEETEVPEEEATPTP